FDQEKRARGFTARCGIHQNGRVVPLGESIGQIVAADAEINDSHLPRQTALRQFVDDFDPESVVTEKYIADTGYEDSLHRALMRMGSTPSTPYKERCPGGRLRPSSSPGSCRTQRPGEFSPRHPVPELRWITVKFRERNGMGCLPVQRNSSCPAAEFCSI